MPDQDKDDFALKPQQPPEPLPLEAPDKKKKPAKKPVGARAKASEADAAILSYRHPHKRKNNPDVGVVTPETDPDQAKTAWAYDPHIDPALQFDSGRAQFEKLIDDALASGDEAVMKQAWNSSGASPRLISTGLARPSAPVSMWTRFRCMCTSASTP
jgi:adenine-specific DNA-methyltransferase